MALNTPPGSPRESAASDSPDDSAGENAKPVIEMAQAEDMYRLLVETVRDYAIFLLDPRGHVMTWNAGAQRFKGYKPDEILGKHFSTFYTAEDIATRKPWYELEVASEVGRFEDEGWRLRQDGTRFWANVVITALFDRNQKLVGFAKVTRDLTERRAAELQAIEDARRVAESEAANRARLEFLTSLSHELRTPLNAIGGYVDLILMGLRGTISAEQKEDLDRVRSNQQHLLLLINDLLNFSRIDAGRVEYAIEPVSLDEIISKVTPMLEVMASNKGIKLEIPTVPADLMARADRTKTEQILLNLLSNAIKFTPRGGKISISSNRKEDRVLIQVVDTGVGIPPDRLDHVFEPFVQLGRSLTSTSEGTGLGLAISRDLARAMGGDLTAISAVGVGSTFTLSLPKV